VNELTHLVSKVNTSYMKAQEILASKSHETDVWNCSICRKRFCTLHELIVHLEFAYPRFEFKFVHDKKGADNLHIVDVMLLPQSCTAADYRIFVLEKNLLRNLRRRMSLGPDLKDYQCMEDNICVQLFKSNRKVPIPSESTNPATENLLSKYAPYNPQLTYSKLKNPPFSNLYGVDTTQHWMKKINETKLDRNRNITEDERSFFKIWNRFVAKREFRQLGYTRTQILLEKFLDSEAQNLFDGNLIANFLLHLVTLMKINFINEESFRKTMLYLHNLEANFSGKTV